MRTYINPYFAAGNEYNGRDVPTFDSLAESNEKGAVGHSIILSTDDVYSPYNEKRQVDLVLVGAKQGPTLYGETMREYNSHGWVNLTEASIDNLITALQYYRKKVYG